MNVFKFLGGSNEASISKEGGAVKEAESATKLFGLQNFGNTCYANSVLQALYFCEPFRERVQALGSPPSSPRSPRSNLDPLPSPNLANGHARSASKSGAPALAAKPPTTRRTSSYHGDQKLNGQPRPLSTDAAILDLGPRDESVTLFETLQELFNGISQHRDSTGVIAPRAFIQTLKRENELFRSTMHQDAHEFLNYLLNAVAEECEKEDRERKANGKKIKDDYVSKDGSRDHLTWVHGLFEGTLTNETRCLTCETVTSRDESFLDLSIDIEANTSITACLRQFSASEMLCSKNKFLCDTCCGLQEAEKRMKIKHLPDILALHLKRFKWLEDVQRFTKLNHRVVFPFELRLFNTVDSSPDADRMYNLWAIVVHIGAGLHHGHYISLIKSNGRWLVFDDDNITQVDEAVIAKYFGDTPGNGSGYVLFYQAADLVNKSPLTTVKMEQANESSATVNQTDAQPTKVSGLKATRPISLEVNTAVETLSSPLSANSAKERKSFFGLQNRRSLSRTRDPSPNSARQRTATNETELHNSFASLISDTSGTTSSPAHKDVSDAASFSTSSSGNVSSLAAPVPPVPQMPHSITTPNLRHAASTVEKPSSPARPQLNERKTLGRFFGRSKSVRNGATSEPVENGHIPELLSQQPPAQSFSETPDRRQFKEQIKEQVKREKETAKEQVREAKEMAKSSVKQAKEQAQFSRRFKDPLRTSA